MPLQCIQCILHSPIEMLNKIINQFRLAAQADLGFTVCKALAPFTKNMAQTQTVGSMPPSATVICVFHGGTTMLLVLDN